MTPAPISDLLHAQDRGGASLLARQAKGLGDAEAYAGDAEDTAAPTGNPERHPDRRRAARRPARRRRVTKEDFVTPPRERQTKERSRKDTHARLDARRPNT